MNDTPLRRGGLRNPPGGRPRRDKARGKRVKIGTLFLYPDTVKWLQQQGAEEEDIRTILERLIEAQRAGE